MMHGHEKSDPAIVVMKPANKAEGPSAARPAEEKHAAESVERRRWNAYGKWRAPSFRPPRLVRSSGTGPTRLTPVGLRDMLEKVLAAEYGVSRDTGRKARNSVLAGISVKTGIPSALASST
jgi:hypothetical protein